MDDYVKKNISKLGPPLPIPIPIETIEKDCLDSRPLCLPVDQLGFPPWSLVWGIYRPSTASLNFAAEDENFPSTGGSAIPAF